MSLSLLHEAVVSLLRESPEFVAQLVSANTGARLPATARAVVVPADLNEAPPAALSADAVLLFSDDHGGRIAVVVEVQRRPDQAKRWRWPHYLAAVSAKYDCPAVLVVVCTDESTARWARRLPNRYQKHAERLPLINWQPIVIGPETIPRVVEPEQASLTPEAAVLSVIAHGQTDPSPFAAAFSAALTSVDNTDPERARRYYNFAVAALPASSARLLEETMRTLIPNYAERLTSEAQQRGFELGEARGLAAGEARGLAAGEARGLIKILETRGFNVSMTVRDRIARCSDLGQIEAWIGRAVTADTVEDVFV